jgi:metal-sulfur cluster biosynthetic enzyme
MISRILSRLLSPSLRPPVLPDPMPQPVASQLCAAGDATTAGQMARREIATPSKLTQEDIEAALRTVIDPELGFNLVDLGLIYGIEVQGFKVIVRMTLTTRGCPMHQSLLWGVRRALLNLEPVEEVDVLLLWDPPWHPSLMSSAVAAQMGGAGAEPFHSV